MKFPGEYGNSTIQLEIFEVGPDSKAWMRYLEGRRLAKTSQQAGDSLTSFHDTPVQDIPAFGEFTDLILAIYEPNEVIGGVPIQRRNIKGFQLADLSGLWICSDFEDFKLSQSLFLSALTLCYIKGVTWVIGFGNPIDVKSQFQKQSAERALLQDIFQSFRTGQSYLIKNATS